MSLDENNSMLGRRRATTKSKYSLDDGFDDEGYPFDPKTGRRIGDKNGDIAAVFRSSDDDDDDEDDACIERAGTVSKMALEDAEDEEMIGGLDGDDFSVVADAGGNSSSKRKGKGKGEGGEKASKKRKGESKNDGGGKVSKKRPNDGELKDDNDGSAPKKQRKENTNPNNKAVSTALVKADGAKSTINEEGASDTKKAILDSINNYRCSSSKCDKNYVDGNIYTEEQPSGIGFCKPHFKKAMAALTDKEKKRHEELKVLRMLERMREMSNASLINGATLDEHIYNLAKDPELPSIEVDDAGLLTILAGSFTVLYRILKAMGYTYKDEQALMDALRKTYAALPDKLICAEGHGPDDEGQTYLEPGWKDRNVLLWFDQYDLDEHDGVPEFGVSDEWRKYQDDARKRRKSKKAAAKEAAAKEAEKKRSKTKVASAAAASMKSAPTATAGKKRAATATIVPATAAKKPTYKANPAATAALAAVLESAQDNQNGVPDAKVLAKALVFGYSKAFIDVKIAEQEKLNVKPAAR
ncbi:hypothetical protein ACHAWC_005387 [Mediolabrus comicus]